MSSTWHLPRLRISTFSQSPLMCQYLFLVTNKLMPSLPMFTHTHSYERKKKKLAMYNVFHSLSLFLFVCVNSPIYYMVEILYIRRWPLTVANTLSSRSSSIHFGKANDSCLLWHDTHFITPPPNLLRHLITSYLFSIKANIIVMMTRKG